MSAEQRRRDPGQLFYRLAAYRGDGRIEAKAKPCSSIRRAAASDIAAIQIAKHIGANVIGTASAPSIVELRALGADHLIDYRSEDFEKKAREMTGGRGVELILDAVGGKSFKKGLPTCSRRPDGSACSACPPPGDRNKTSEAFAAWSRCSPSTPWLQFNPLAAAQRQQRRVRRQSRPYVGRGRPHPRSWADQIRGCGRKASSGRKSPGPFASTRRLRPPITSSRTAATWERCCSSRSAVRPEKVVARSRSPALGRALHI